MQRSITTNQSVYEKNLERAFAPSVLDPDRSRSREARERSRSVPCRTLRLSGKDIVCRP